MKAHYDDRPLTADETAALIWWESLSDDARRAAMQLAKATTVAQAWDWQKQALETEDSM